MLHPIRTQLALLAASSILAGVVSVGCSAPRRHTKPNETPPPIPPVAPAPAHALAAFEAAPAPILQLTWDYPEALPATNILFEVWQSLDLQRWSLLTTVKEPPVFLGGSGSMFFAVYTLDTSTGLRGE